MNVGLLILRVVAGLVFAGHGAQKLFGWFGGPGLEGAGGFFEQIGYRPGRRMAAVASLTEIGAGLLLASGFLTPLAAAAIIGVMINAFWTVKRPLGLYNGYEIDMIYATIAAALVFTGAGAYSVDGALNWSLAGTEWGLGAIGLGLVTALGVLASRRVPRPVEQFPADEERRAA
ncbi:MAG: DoxX family protein [Actinomycetota bacterium]